MKNLLAILLALTLVACTQEQKTIAESANELPNINQQQLDKLAEQMKIRCLV